MEPRPPATSSLLGPREQRAAEGKQKWAFDFSATALIFLFFKKKTLSPHPGGKEVKGGQK